MSKMKKILGILLALCFVLSVTAGAASAGEHKDYKKDDHKDYKKDGHKDYKKNDHKDHKKFIKVWVPGHVEKKVVKDVIYKHHKKIVVKKIIKKWVPGHWKYKEVSHRNHHGHK